MFLLLPSQFSARSGQDFLQCGRNTVHKDVQTCKQSKGPSRFSTSGKRHNQVDFKIPVH